MKEEQVVLSFLFTDFRRVEDLFLRTCFPVLEIDLATHQDGHQFKNPNPTSSKTSATLLPLGLSSHCPRKECVALALYLD